MSEEWIVIATAENVTRAQLAVAHLQSEGFAARIEHEHMSNLLPSFGLLSAGVQIKVPWQQARAAYELLETYASGESGLWL